MKIVELGLDVINGVVWLFKAAQDMFPGPFMRPDFYTGMWFHDFLINGVAPDAGIILSIIAIPFISTAAGFAGGISSSLFGRNPFSSFHEGPFGGVLRAIIYFVFLWHNLIFLIIVNSIFRVGVFYEACFLRPMSDGRSDEAVITGRIFYLIFMAIPFSVFTYTLIKYLFFI